MTQARLDLQVRFLIISTLLLGVTRVNCRSTGAPSEACSTLTPQHGTTAQTSASPYSIDLSNLDISGDDLLYLPGKNYLITLSGISSQTFRGFLIQGRQQADDTTVLGEFTSLDSNTRFGNCSTTNGSVTHNSANEKSSVSITWIAPPQGSGSISFAFAVVSSYSTFWANQRTAVIAEYQEINPRIASVERHNPRSMTVNWTQVISGTGYRLRLGTPNQNNFFEFQGLNTISRRLTGLTPFNYTSSTGVTYAISVARLFEGGDGMQIVGSFSDPLMVTFPQCPGQCDYRTHVHTGISCTSIGNCECNPAFSGINCTEPNYIPRNVFSETSRILSSTTYALQVTWMDPDPSTLDGRAVDRYRVVLADFDGNPLFSDDTIPAGNFSYELQNLVSETSYEVTVSTITDVAMDPPAYVLNDRLHLTVHTPDAVASLSARVEVLFMSRLLIVEWTEPTNAINYFSLLQITGYRVEAFYQGSRFTLRIVSENTTQSQISLTSSIPPAANLTVEVSAINAAGQGPVSQVIVTTPPNVCPESQYGLPNDTMCFDCPNNSMSQEGAQTIDDCVCLAGFEKSLDGNCTALTCPSLSVDNGVVTYDNEVLLLGTTATYSCDSGFSLSGDGTRMCTDSGGNAVWSGSQPSCVDFTCPPLSVGNGSVAYDNEVLLLGTTANYSCIYGFSLSGNGTRMCGVDGNAIWSGSQPSCVEDAACDPVPDLINGTVIYDQPATIAGRYPDGTVGTYTCDQFFYLATYFNQGNQTCLLLFGTIGVWHTGNFPECRLVSCPSLAVPANGSVVYDSPSDPPLPEIEDTTMATYSCDAGHSLNGSVNRICTVRVDSRVEGVWNGSVDPQCIPCPIGQYAPGENSSPSCIQCGGLVTTTVEGSTSCDACRYSSPRPTGQCFRFDTVPIVHEPVRDDIVEDIISNTWTFTLRWNTVPSLVQDINGDTVGPTVAIRIFCVVVDGVGSNQSCSPGANSPFLTNINIISTTMFDVENLQPLVQYQFDVVLVAEEADMNVGGPPGLQVTVITPALTPDDSRLPQITMVTPSSDSYVVHYMMPADLVPLVTSIGLNYSSTSSAGVTLTPTTDNITAVGTLTTMSLLPTTDVVYFQLSTKIGFDTYNSTVYQLDPLVLTAPIIDQGQSVVLNSTAVLLVWSSVPGAVSYVVTVDVVEGSDRTIRIPTLSTGTSLVVTNLQPGVAYLFQVAAENSMGMGGPLSSPFSLTTLEGIPSPPLNVRIEDQGSFINIVWEPPEFPNGVITQYTVTLTLLSGITTFEANDLFLRLPKPDSAYSVTVQAVNSAGRGEAAAPEAGTNIPGPEGLTETVIIIIAAVGGVVLLLILLIIAALVGCCCYRRRSRKAGFNINTDFIVQNPGHEGISMEEVTQRKKLNPTSSSSSLASLVPRYSRPHTDLPDVPEDKMMYAEVNEMQMMKARETVKKPVALPYESFLPKRDATPEDYNNEELYMEMGKIYYADADKTNILAAYEVDRSAVVFESDLGQGQFGKVSKAKMKNIVPGKAESPVAVKMLKEGANERSRKDFLGEAQMLATFDHINVLGLLKVVTKSEPILVVIPFMANGDLKTYLKNKKKKKQSENFGVIQQVHIAEQIAAGMEYLAAKFFIHRDLAARNILVGDDNHCKIADFGLSRALAQEDTYYHVSEASMLPVKWMAIESLMYRKFSSYSDVWSFGVVLWEIFSYGASPYKGVSLKDVPNHVQEGHRLECPEKCPNEIYEMMTRCWDEVKEKRSTFSQMKLRLKAIGIGLKRANDKNHQSEEDEYMNFEEN